MAQPRERRLVVLKTYAWFVVAAAVLLAMPLLGGFGTVEVTIWLAMWVIWLVLLIRAVRGRSSTPSQ